LKTKTKNRNCETARESIGVPAQRIYIPDIMYRGEKEKEKRIGIPISPFTANC